MHMHIQLSCSLCLRLICWNALKTSWSTRFTAKKPAIKLSYLWLRRLVLLSTQKGLWERATLHPLPCRVESQWYHARTNKMMLRSDLQNDFVEFYQNTKMCLSQRNFTLLQNQAFGGRIHNSASLTIIFPGLERIFLCGKLCGRSLVSIVRKLARAEAFQPQITNRLPYQPPPYRQ